MSTAATGSELQPLALRPGQAARALSLSDESFQRYVSPHVRWTRIGSIKLVSVRELERFLHETGALTLERDE